MKTYTISFADSRAHLPEYPERTAKRNSSGFNFDVTYQVWPNRQSMLKTIQMQEKRASKPTDWKPITRS